MSTTASIYTPGFGSTIAYAPITYSAGVGTVGTYVPIAQTRDLNSPMAEVGDIKVTNNQSPGNSHEYAPGLIEPGDVEWDVVYLKTAFETIVGLVGNQLTYSFKETFPPSSDGTVGAVCTFVGYWKGAGIETKTEDEAIIGKMKVKLTTAAVWS